MNSALDRLDHDQAHRVGTLLLELVPDAAEAPEVISLLIALANDDRERAALEETRAREYGADSRWVRAHPGSASLGNANPRSCRNGRPRCLSHGPDRRGVSRPTSGGFERQLLARAARVGEGCQARLAPSPQRVRVHVDTTGPVPAASVSGVSTAAFRCIQRPVKAEFRSVGPAKIDFVLRRAADRSVSTKAG